MIKAVFFIALCILTINIKAQNEVNTPQKNLISICVFEYTNSTSLNYQRQFLNWEKPKLSAGAGVGFGYDLLNINLAPKQGYSSPAYLYLEYGNKHVIGANIGYAYKWVVLKGYKDVPKTYFNMNAAFASLYYRYHFGNSGKFNLGIMGQYNSYFGNTNLANEFSLGVNFGFRF